MKNDFPRIHISTVTRRTMIEIARGFRKEPTKGEKILWAALRGKRLGGIKFRRQQPVGYFVVDFYSSAYRLVVELEGPIHEFQEKVDKARQEILEQLGLVVLRIRSEVVERNLPAALDMIRKTVDQISQNTTQNIPSLFIRDGKGGV